jgi:prolipoprotein diacylglyceryltransferase
MSLFVMDSKEELFGKYCRISPLVFSLAPLSQEWYGLAK